MYPITDEAKALFESENRKVLNILGTDVNGNYFRITDADVIQDSFQIDRYCCNGERLEIGTTIAAQLSMKLENSDGRFNNTIFEGAELYVNVGVADWTQENPTVYWVPCGYFICDYQPRKLNIITITALDRMIRLDAVVDRSLITLPTTPVTLISDIAGICNVGYRRQANLPNAVMPIDELPDDAISYRNLIAWCAGLMGTNAFVDWTGTLYFSFYSNTANYVSTIDNRYNSDLYENDLSITGVTYTTDDGIEYVEGTGDYAFDLTGNVFISPIITAALPNLNNAVNGFTYRPFTASVINAPYLWPMDIITFRDKDGNDHQTALTNVCFGLNGTTALESRGMTYIINRQKIIGSFTKEQTQFINRMNNDLRSEMVTGVKGNEESLYRQGNVNLTPANIGAVAKSGDTMTGPLKWANGTALPVANSLQYFLGIDAFADGGTTHYITAARALNSFLKQTSRTSIGTWNNSTSVNTYASFDANTVAVYFRLWFAGNAYGGATQEAFRINSNDDYIILLGENDYGGITRIGVSINWTTNTVTLKHGHWADQNWTLSIYKRT